MFLFTQCFYLKSGRGSLRFKLLFLFLLIVLLSRSGRRFASHLSCLLYRTFISLVSMSLHQCCLRGVVNTTQPAPQHMFMLFPFEGWSMNLFDVQCQYYAASSSAHVHAFSVRGVVNESVRCSMLSSQLLAELFAQPARQHQFMLFPSQLLSTSSCFSRSNDSTMSAACQLEFTLLSPSFISCRPWSLSFWLCRYFSFIISVCRCAKHSLISY